MVLVGLVWSDFKSRGACTETFPKEIYHLSYAKHISHPEDISFALGQSPSQSPAVTALPKGEPRGRLFEQGLAVFQSLPLGGRWLAQRDGGSLPTNRAADAPIFLSQKRKLLTPKPRDEEHYIPRGATLILSFLSRQRFFCP